GRHTIFSRDWSSDVCSSDLAADTTRRIIHIRLDVLEEKPEERTGFKHPELLTWIRQNRPRLLTAALTILRAYCNAGMPRQDLSRSEERRVGKECRCVYAHSP